jgi:hypothetical protein
MNHQQYTGADEDIELDTQELIKRQPEETLGYGHGEWASTTARSQAQGERGDGGDSGVERRVAHVEAELDALRATTSSLAREVALLRADLERLRQECEKAAGSKLP